MESRKASHLGRKDNGRNRKRVEEEEDDYNDSEHDDEENDELEIDDDDDSHDDGASQSDGGDSAMQVEKDLPSQVGNNVEVTSDLPFMRFIIFCHKHVMFALVHMILYVVSIGAAIY